MDTMTKIADPEADVLASRDSGGCRITLRMIENAFVIHASSDVLDDNGELVRTDEAQAIVTPDRAYHAFRHPFVYLPVDFDPYK